MIWVRLLVAILLTAFVVVGISSVALTITPGLSPFNLDAMSTPGLSGPDSTALQTPYQELVARQDDVIVQALAEGSDRNAAREILPRLRALIPDSKPTATRLVRWTETVGTNGRTLNAVQEYHYVDRVVRADTTLVQTPTGWKILDFEVHAISRAQAMANAFTLSGRSPALIAFVIAAALVPLFVLATALSDLLRKNVKRRWLWLLFILVGLATFRLNGATGAMSWQPLSFQLFSGSAIWSGSAFDPWIFGLSVPIGAIAYWLLSFRPNNQSPPLENAGGDGGAAA